MMMMRLLVNLETIKDMDGEGASQEKAEPNVSVRQRVAGSSE